VLVAILFHLPISSLECLFQHVPQILILKLILRFPTDDNIFTGQTDINGDVEQVSSFVATMRNRYRDVALDYSVAE